MTNQEEKKEKWYNFLIYGVLIAGLGIMIGFSLITAWFGVIDPSEGGRKARFLKLVFSWLQSLEGNWMVTLGLVAAGGFLIFMSVKKYQNQNATVETPQLAEEETK